MVSASWRRRAASLPAQVVDQPAQFLGVVPAVPAERGDAVAEGPFHDGAELDGGAEGQLAGDHEVQADAEAVPVGGALRQDAAHGLGRHELRRADQRRRRG